MRLSDGRKKAFRAIRAREWRVDGDQDAAVVAHFRDFLLVLALLHLLLLLQSVEYSECCGRTASSLAKKNIAKSDREEIFAPCLLARCLGQAAWPKRTHFTSLYSESTLLAPVLSNLPSPSSTTHRHTTQLNRS